MPRAKKTTSVDVYLDTLKEVTGEKKMPPRRLIKPIQVVEAEKKRAKKKPVKKTTKKVAKPRKKKVTVNQILIDSPSVLEIGVIAPDEVPVKKSKHATVIDLADARAFEKAHPVEKLLALVEDDPVVKQVAVELRDLNSKIRDIENQDLPAYVDPNTRRGYNWDGSEFEPNTVWTRVKRFFRKHFGE